MAISARLVNFNAYLQEGAAPLLPLVQACGQTFGVLVDVAGETGLAGEPIGILWPENHNITMSFTQWYLHAHGFEHSRYY